MFRRAFDYSRIYLISAILMAISCLSIVSEIPVIASVSFASSFLVVFVSFALYITEHRKIQQELLIMIMLIIMMILAIIVSSWKTRISIQLLKQAVIGVAVLICFYFSGRFAAPEKDKSCIILLFAVLTAYIELRYYFGPLKYSYYSLSSKLITLNFSNPNETGLWLTMVFIILTIGMNFQKSIWVRCFLVIELVLMIPILLAIGSRSALIVLLLYVLGYIYIIMKSKLSLNKIVLLVVIVMPIIFYAFYMFLVVPNTELFEKLFAFMTKEGKSLLNREKVWRVITDSFGSLFFSGDYVRFQAEQMHNSLATIFSMYGAPYTVLLCTYMYVNLQRLNNEKQILSLWGLCAILLTGLFEASIFVGVTGLYLVLLVIPSLSFNRESDFRENIPNQMSQDDLA